MSENVTESARLPCCEGSLAAGEQLFATAPRADVWLLLEHHAAWGAKALPESGLSEEIKAFLACQLETIPRSRFQFIKQRGEKDGLAFFVALPSESGSSLYRFHLTAYEDLLAFDLPAIVAGSPDYAAHRTGESLFLVCTNGKRDLCCARYGLPLYQKMSQLAGAAAWQTTHLGGHRFAGTMVCLRSGVYYGRLVADEAQSVLEAAHEERIVIEKYRGRCIYDAPVQAADYFLRQKTGNPDLDAFKLIQAEARDEQRWRVSFTEVQSQQEHLIQLSAAPSDFEIYENTSGGEKTRVRQYQLEA